MFSRRTVLKPVSENDKVYVPARRSTMRYWPVASVTALRVFSISAGLDASTVTPGSTPPDVSRTVPARLCADAMLGTTARIAITTNDRTSTGRMSENLQNGLVDKGSVISGCRECADYGPFDGGSQGLLPMCPEYAQRTEVPLRERTA